MALIQTVHLSMANFKSAPVVPAVQNDSDRQVKMIIDDYTLTSGLTGKIAFERSDGTHYETAAELVLADNAFVADIDQALTQPGRTMVQLKVTDTLTASTFSFVIFVEADNSGTVTPQEGIDLVTAVEAAESAADRAESAASTLELDATLTSPTKAAQAKAVGDAICELKNAFKADIHMDQQTTDYTTPYTKGYVNLNGVPQTVTESSELGYTDKISVQPGDVITATRIASGSSLSLSMRFVTAYNGASAVSAKGAENISSYTVPDGIDGVQITASFYATVGTDITVHITRQGIQYTTYRLIDEPIGYFRAAGDLASGEKMLLPEQNIAIGEMIAFECNIGASLTGSVKVGRYFDNAAISHITVDNTNVVVTDAYGTDYTYPHGLTVANNLQVRIIRYGSLTNKLDKLIVTSNGVDYSVNVSAYTWNGYKGQPFAEAVGQSLTKCVLSSTSANIMKPIWIFGDSFITKATSRWAYYMNEDGYDKNVLFVGYPGETSAQNLVSLQSLIATGAYPQYLVWCMGMNDPDDETNNVVNANWKDCYDYIVDLCEHYPITPVFATIPCVPATKHHLNIYKNQIVTESGYRYIDFATAVGATETNSSWYSGMLDSDDIHPTAAGAKALYGRVLVDLPEVTVG